MNLIKVGNKIINLDNVSLVTLYDNSKAVEIFWSDNGSFRIDGEPATALWEYLQGPVIDVMAMSLAEQGKRAALRDKVKEVLYRRYQIDVADWCAKFLDESADFGGFSGVIDVVDWLLDCYENREGAS